MTESTEEATFTGENKQINLTSVKPFLLNISGIIESSLSFMQKVS